MAEVERRGEEGEREAGWESYGGGEGGRKTKRQGRDQQRGWLKQRGRERQEIKKIEGGGGKRER